MRSAKQALLLAINKSDLRCDYLDGFQLQASGRCNPSVITCTRYMIVELLPDSGARVPLSSNYTFLLI